MAKPADIVEWDATGHLVEPPGGKKTQGWLPGEQPSNTFMNWLFNLLGQWTSYLNNLESTEALTWVLSQIFEKAITLGNDYDANETEAISPRLIVEPVSSSVADYTLVAKFKDAYLWIKGLGSSSAFSITVNATRTTDGSDKWKKITSSQPAFMLQVSRDGLSFSSMPATQNTNWTDAFVDGEGTSSAWGRSLNFQSEGAARSVANQDIPVLSQQFNTGTSNTRGHIGQFAISGQRNCHLYVVRLDGALNDQSFEVVFGAFWDGTNNRWVRELTSTVVKYNFGPKGFFVDFKEGGSAGGNFTSWDTKVFDWQFPTTTTGTSTATDHGVLKVANAKLKVIGTASDDVDDANPPFGTSHANEVGCRNVLKVSAYFISLGGADGNITPLSGYNLSSAADAVAQAGDVLTVKFGTALADANYEATITCEFDSTTHKYDAMVKSKSASQIQIRIYDTTLGSPADCAVADLNTLNIGVNLQISGKQTT